MRSWLRVLVPAGLVLLLVCGGATAAQHGPIKIGIIWGYTGWEAPFAKPMEAGVRLALQQEGPTFGGRSVQFIIADTASNVNTGLTKLRKLVEEDHVALVLGVQSTGIADAARDFMARNGTPWITLAAPAGFTRDQFAENIFRVTPSTVQYSYRPAEWLQRHGYKKVIWIGADYAAPHEVFEAFKKVYGKNLVEALWPPQGTVDYAPYIARINPKKADLLVVAMWGTDAIRLMKQYRDAGLKSKLPVFGLASFTSPLVLPAMGKSADGVLSSYVYCGGLDTAANEKFRRAFEKESGGQVPAHYPYLAYLAGRIAFKALKEVGGRIEDRGPFLHALETVRVNGPMGTVYFDRKHGMVHDLYMLKTVMSPRGPHNQCLGKMAQVRDPVQVFPEVGSPK